MFKLYSISLRNVSLKMINQIIIKKLSYLQKLIGTLHQLHSIYRKNNS